MSKPNHLYVVPDETPRITPVGFDGGEPPMSNLEKRVEKLEERLSKVNTDLEVLKSNNATKADLQGMKAELFGKFDSQTKWIVRSVIGVLLFLLATMAGLLKWLVS
ncbi:hypothetical protein HMPREF1119_1019 [Haemophilus parainfluenzae HK2019]|jgi:hypothetical protein|uniref:Haemolysin XhlA n=1 Tax=Haemophilus parainfluenzae HK2019 TaxID=1095746 RepID=A0ABN0ESM7_HAEPA|nr:hypothetical protein [Haemophilus parainfluenzae]EIJ28571.1 hypothetical protein HMPREF1119_1019 [Haemophilus parainfluenzae HK2019]OBX75023.1 hypothetical protein A9298_09710 [Haemophilus parainfluenzae]